MAKIKWHDLATMMLDFHVGYASLEYGKSTAMRWKTEIAAIEDTVSRYPEVYPPEELLKDGLSMLFATTFRAFFCVCRKTTFLSHAF